MSWNPFTKKMKTTSEKSTEDVLEELSKSLDTLSSSGTSSVATTSSSSGPLLGGSFGTTTSTPFFGVPSISPGSFMWPNGLTKEEEAELKILEEDYRVEQKALKIIEFKKLPTELRQFVINMIMWQEAVNNINGCLPNLSDKMQELKNKRVNSFISGLNYASGFHVTTNAPVPEGLTFEDLKNAHAEQALEEEVLREKS